MHRTLPILIAALVAAVPPAVAAPGDHQGWGWLVERLVRDGVDRAAVERAFDDPRMPAFDRLDFGMAPHEPRSLYRGFLKPASIAAARECRARHADEFQAAAAAHGVPANVIAAIIHVESGCGRHTGQTRILHALARLAMADEPANLQRNFYRLAPSGDPADEARVRERAARLGGTFYPEVRATFDVAARLGVDPLEMRGSGSGAFGAPQFLPTSYFAHGCDGDADGRVDLYDPADAASSCAAYLAANGWHSGLSAAAKRRVIWSYNHSDAYIDTVLAIANAIDRPAPVRVVQTAKKGRPARAKSAVRTVKAKPKPAPVHEVRRPVVEGNATAEARVAREFTENR